LGSGPAAVDTDKALFRFDTSTNEMYLDTIYPGEDVQDIKSLVGWELKIAPELKVAPEPTDEELAAVRASDPANLIMGGVAARKRLSGLDEYIEITIKNSGK